MTNPRRRETWFRRGFVALMVPALLFVSVQDGQAILGVITGAAQRAIIIAQQLTQIGHQISTLREARDQVDNLEDQLEQMRDQALGEIGALTDAFADLSSTPASLLGGGGALSWASDFSGDVLPVVQAVSSLGAAGEVLTNQWRQQLADADEVTAADILDLFDDPDEGAAAVAALEARRQAGDRRRVYDYAAMDAAERLAETLEAAQLSLAGVRSQTNMSETALQQAAVTGQLTTGEIEVAQAQLAAYASIQDAVDRQAAEVERRRELAEWVAAEEASRDVIARANEANAERAQVYRDALLLPAGGGN